MRSIDYDEADVTHVALERQVPRTPDGEAIYAQGVNGRGRGKLFAIGLAAGVAAVPLGVLFGDVEIVGVAVLLLVGVCVACLPLAIWRQGRSFIATRDGITLQVGTKTFGESYLVPWRDVEWLGVVPCRGGRGKLAIRQSGIGGRTTLPMKAIDRDEAEAIAGRLRERMGS